MKQSRVFLYAESPIILDFTCMKKIIIKSSVWKSDTALAAIFLHQVLFFTLYEASWQGKFVRAPPSVMALY